MLRHQQQLLGQVDHGRMIWPGPQLDAEVADSLDAGLVLDRSEELEGLDAELAGLVDLALVDTDRGLIGEIAGALVGLGKRCLRVDLGDKHRRPSCSEVRDVSDRCLPLLRG